MPDDPDLPDLDYDREKVDETVLALLWLTLHDDHRAWKGHDWDVLERLHQRGYIDDPKNKAKSVLLTEEGKRRSRGAVCPLLQRRGKAHARSLTPQP